MRIYPLLIVAAALSGCNLLPHEVAVRPASTPATASVDPYEMAVQAIRDKDNVRALEWLQRASRQGESVRVLNAYGVVYDNLGRFDLSARYYARAEALDPGSKIVAANRAYSEQLRQSATDLALNVLPNVKPKAADILTAPSAMPDVELAQGGQGGLIGRPVEIVDATTAQHTGAVLLGRLRGRGWSVRQGRPETDHAAPATRIEYAGTFGVVAHALARTLGGDIALSPRADVAGIRLIIGDDFRMDKVAKSKGAGTRR